MRSKAPAVALLSAAVLASACSGGAKASPKAAVAPTPSATPIVVKPAAVVHDVLTGSTTVGHASLVAIKVDNAPLARPYQTGLDKAAVVYQEIVEGGYTRFLAVFESDVAGSTEVGPIRSGRESDVDILRAFGKIPIGFSGAQPGVLSIFRSAASHGWLRVASYDDVPGAYRLGARRKDARNFFTTPAKLAAAKPGTGPTDIGFRFGTPTGGLPTSSATAVFSPDSRVTLTWNPAKGSYSVAQNGSLTNGAAPATVIIQSVPVSSSGFVDVHKQPTPRTLTTGSGKVVVLRGGARVVGTWKRSGLGATHYLDAAGKDITMAAGPVWVLLLPRTSTATFS